MILKYAKTLDLGDVIEFGGQWTRVDWIQEPESRNSVDNGFKVMAINLVNAIGQVIEITVPETMAFLVEAE